MAAPLMSSNVEAAASNAAKYGFRAWQASKAGPPATAKEAALGIRESTQTVKEVNGAPKQLTSNVGKTAGRNSAGRITIFHRGGGAKRLYRRIDMKRSTSAMGIVERIEYDPNRSSRIALVRWAEGAHLSFRKKCKAVEEKFVPPQKIFEPITATTCGQFSLASLSRDVDQMDTAGSAPRKTGKYAVVGLQSALLPGSKNLSAINGAKSKKTCARDVFLSAFSTQRPKRETAASFAFNASFNLPRIAVAGAKPPLFASHRRGKDEEKSTFSLSEIQKWNQQSKHWANRSKPKAAISWQSFRWQYSSEFVGDADCDKLNLGTNCVSLPEGDASKSSSQKQ